MVDLSTSPFGSLTRSRVLMALCLMGTSYARELARVLESAVSGIQGAIRSLEADGLVVGAGRRPHARVRTESAIFRRVGSARACRQARRG